MPELHADRARATSFGTAAHDYDRYRPGPPDALADDLAALRPAGVLDVGCGTGKAAAALAARGLPVLGVEVDERMAALARGHGLAVEVSPFETWDPARRTFDLVVCGDAWHWLDPVAGTARAAAVLGPGGTLARFWTTYAVGADVAAVLDAVYDRYAPEVARVWRPGPPYRHPDSLAGRADFTATSARHYPWRRMVGTDDWLGAASTVSDHRQLGPRRLHALLAALRRAVDDGLGAAVPVRYETLLLVNRRR